MTTIINVIGTIGVLAVAGLASYLEGRAIAMQITQQEEHDN